MPLVVTCGSREKRMIYISKRNKSKRDSNNENSTTTKLIREREERVDLIRKGPQKNCPIETFHLS